MSDVNRGGIGGIVNNISNNNNIDGDDLIPANFPPPPKAIHLLQRSSSINKQHTSSGSPAINQNDFASSTIRPATATVMGNHHQQQPSLNANKPDLFNFASNVNNSIGMMMDEREISSNNCQSNKLAYPVFFCDDQQQQPSQQQQQQSQAEKSSFYFFHHEPPNYLPNYDNISSTKYPIVDGKYNTMVECPAFPLQHFNIPISKVQHASTCNLNNQFNSSNLINNHHLSNSLNNFNMIDTQIQNYYNFNPSFTQLPRGTTTGSGVAPFGSSSIIGSSFASNISLNGTPKNPNMPWKHRQCSSRSSSSGTNSSSEYKKIQFNFIFFLFLYILYPPLEISIKRRIFSA